MRRTPAQTSRTHPAARIQLRIQCGLSAFVMGAMMSFGAANAAEITRWFSPNGTGDGTTSGSPRPFSASYINTNLLADTSCSVVRIHLLGNTTNDYVVTQRLEIPSRADRSTLKVVIASIPAQRDVLVI